MCLFVLRLDTTMLVSIAPILSATATDTFLDKGIMGAALVVVSGVAWKLCQIFINDRDTAFIERKEMTQDLLTKVFPAITKNTEVLEKRQELDEKLLEAMLENNNLLQRQARAFEDLERGLRHNGVPR